MKSVVWNDCIQFAIYMVGALLAGWVLLDKLPGGWSDVVAYGRAHGKFRLWDLSLTWSEPYTLWAGLLGGVFLTLATHGTDQLMVQRYLGARSLRDAARALALSGLVVCGQFALFLLLGVGLAAFFDQHPPATAFVQYDRVFAHFIVDYLPPGILGITLAAVFAAAMSTLSGSLNSSATALVSDFYRPLVGKDADPGHLLRVGRFATFGFGVIQIGVAIAGQQMVTSVVNGVLAIASFTSGAVLGVFFLGIAAVRPGERAVLIGLVAGLGFVSCVAYTTDLAWPWYAIAGSGATYATGRCAGIFWPRQREPLPPEDSSNT